MFRILNLILYNLVGISILPIGDVMMLQLLLSLGIVMVILSLIRRGELQWTQLMNSYTILMLLWLSWSLFSYYWARDQQAWFAANRILLLATIQAFGLTIALLKTQFRETFYYLIALGLLVLQALAWWQVRLQSGSIMDWRLANDMALFNNVNDLALLMYFAIFFFLAFPFGQRIDRKIRLLLKALAVTSSLFILIFTNSRGILFTSALSLGFYLLLEIPRPQLRQAAILQASASLLLLVFVFRAQIWQGLNMDSSFVIRWNLVRNAWDYLLASQGLGVGAGNLAYYLSQQSHYWTNEITDMHNWYMAILGTYGLPFFLYYLALILRNWLASWRLLFHENLAIAKFQVTFLLAFLIVGAIPDTLFNFMWFWLMQAFLALEFEYQINARSRKYKTR